MLNISNNTKKLIEDEIIKYPNLHEYITSFIKNDGESEDKEYLPKLIIWIRNITDDNPIDFNMDEDTYEEFCCWGHNSRWKNVFWNYLIDNINYIIPVCFELAKEHGDYIVNYSET